MTDHQLRLLAAQAAGIKIERDGEASFFYNEFGHVWDPLNDDGDALRLAAKLKIDLEWQNVGVFPTPDVEAYRRSEKGSYYCASEHENDYKRAIVRAAAEIGKALP